MRASKCGMSLICAFFLSLSSCASNKTSLLDYPPMRASLVIAESAPPAPLRLHQNKKLIVIDPGHGGKDNGTQSLLKPIFSEKNLNLVTAKFLDNFLRQLGYRTLLTRNDDFFLSLDHRAQFANTQSSDLFISVHYNAATNAAAEGIEVYYYRPDKNKERAQTSKNLAEIILKRVIEATGAKSRGVKHGNLAVIRKTEMPAVLIEGGFLTNEKELTKLKDPAYLKSIAWAIAEGIDIYMKEVPSKSCED